MLNKLIRNYSSNINNSSLCLIGSLARSYYKLNNRLNLNSSVRYLYYTSMLYKDNSYKTSYNTNSYKTKIEDISLSDEDVKLLISGLEEMKKESYPMTVSEFLGETVTS